MRCAPPHTNRPKRNRSVANNGSDLVTIHPEPCRPLPICLVRVGGFGEVIRPLPVCVTSHAMCVVSCRQGGSATSLTVFGTNIVSGWKHLTKPTQPNRAIRDWSSRIGSPAE